MSKQLNKVNKEHYMGTMVISENVFLLAALIIAEMTPKTICNLNSKLKSEIVK